MANKNGTLISNLQASPQVKSPVYQLGGTMKIAQGIVECVAGDFSGGDTIMLAPIPTGASVVSIKLYHDDIDSGTTITTDVGLYSDSTTVTAIDDDCYASASTALRGAVAAPGTEMAFEARDIDKTGQRVWEDGGQSSDPGGLYYIGLKHDAAGDQGGTVCYVITYVID